MFTGSKFELYFDGSGQILDLIASSVGDAVIQTTSTNPRSITPSHIVSTFDRDSLEVTTSTTRSLSESNPSDCVRVETRNGRSLVLGLDSTLLVSDPESGDLVQCTPDKAVGMLVPICMGTPFKSSQYNFDLAWWYALLVADGWVSLNTVGYSKDDSLKRKRFEEIAASQLTPEFNCREYHDRGESKSKFAPSTKIHLNGARLVEMVESIYHPDKGRDDGSRRGALFKMLPRSLLLNGSEECLWGLLSGLLDGDSSLGWNKFRETHRFYAKLNTSSAYLKDDIAFLLRKLGIRCSTTHVPAKGPSHESYVISISIVSLRSAVRRIRCVGTEETARLSEFSTEYQGRPHHDNLDVIPYPRSLGKQIRQAVGSENGNLYSTVAKAAKSGRITRDAIIARLPADVIESSDAAKKLHRVASNSNLLWDEVVSVTPVEKQPLLKIQVADGLPLVLWDGWVVPSHVPTAENPVPPK